MIALLVALACRTLPLGPHGDEVPDPPDSDPDVDSETDTVVDDGCDDASCEACADAGYWDEVQASPDAGTLSAALRDATAALRCDYDDSRELLFMELFNDSGQVTCVYTGETFLVASYPPDWDEVNTEHTWPQSQGADDDPAQCDLHHLYPTDSQANATRGNTPFGEVTGDVTWSQGGSQLGEDARGELVFEPRDDHKGNVARSMVYFAVRYGYTLSDDQLDLFAAWDTQDPVDVAETTRTWAIADALGTANPFVVCPGTMQTMAGAR